MILLILTLVAITTTTPYTKNNVAKQLLAASLPPIITTANGYVKLSIILTIILAILLTTVYENKSNKNLNTKEPTLNFNEDVQIIVEELEDDTNKDIAAITEADCFEKDHAEKMLEDDANKDIAAITEANCFEEDHTEKMLEDDANKDIAAMTEAACFEENHAENMLAENMLILFPIPYLFYRHVLFSEKISQQLEKVKESLQNMYEFYQTFGDIYVILIVHSLFPMVRIFIILLFRLFSQELINEIYKAGLQK